MEALRPRPAPLEPALVRRAASPALVVDLAAARRNVRAVLDALGPSATERWRPHVKTTKVPAVLDILIAEGLRRFKCATVREARVLADRLDAAGATRADVLVAHHLHGPSLERLAALARARPDVAFSFLVEAPEEAEGAPGGLGLFLDVDTGMGRTGVPLAERDRLLGAAQAAGDRLRGVHAYDGHRTESDPEARRSGIHADTEGLLEALDALRERGARIPELVTAGTPAFPAASAHPALRGLEGTVHRVSPGTVVYHDLRSMAQLPALFAEPAVTVLTRVASVRADGFTVDAGSKAVEASGPGAIARALERPDARALRQSEEHTVFDAAGGLPERGEVLRLVPGHVCPTVNFAETALLVEDGRLVGTQRVAARGHDAPLDD
ncbi:MAG: alanine racemase [Planctomycetota bacterium]